MRSNRSMYSTDSFHSVRTRVIHLTIIIMICSFICTTSSAVVIPEEESRFDRLVIFDPSTRMGIIAETPEAIIGFEDGRIGWETFINVNGGKWKVYVDRRSGSPMLVEGQGIPWFNPGEESFTLNDLNTKARSFISSHSSLFKVHDSELVLNEEGSGPIDENHWILSFDRSISGIPVENQHFIMYITQGNLVAFGADRWGTLTPLDPVHDIGSARLLLYSYMGISSLDYVEDTEPARLVYVSAPPSGFADRVYAGRAGAGVDFKLAWRFELRVDGERGIWVGKVDAITGDIIAFYDNMKYEQVKGGVNPMSNDGEGWEGDEQPDFPMPYADITIDGETQTCNDMGIFIPGPAGSQAVTHLNGPYIKIYDVCGPIDESRAADGDLDLFMSRRSDCNNPPKADSPGDTRATRSSYYHINRAKEKGRYWLPSNNWLKSKLEVITNQGGFNNCNAYWNGKINLYQSQQDKCRNFGEISAVGLHEWGHGLDQNDGGGYDNPSEAYADTIAILYDHHSCVGRGGFFDTCSGYGDTCLECTGVREIDWNKRTNHAPATADGFIKDYCPGGSGPCGKEEHCEGHLGAETIWDLATRDLPASGLDAYTSFQLTEKLFYKSRLGSGGNAYNCSIPNSDGCNASSWFAKLRIADDDDGNLSNGTPHASAIYAAFSRHKIACGTAADPSNQDHSTCPALAVPALSIAAGCSSAQLSWSAVPDAASYLILRNDMKCDASSTIIATVKEPDTAFIDYDLAGGFPLYYRIQAQGTNTACEGAVSACASIMPNAGTLTDEVSGLTVTQGTSAHLSWESQPDAVNYDVAGGFITELIIDRTFTRADCLASNVSDSQWTDTRGDPPAGEGYYYLTRSANSCGAGTYGWKSNGNERIINACP